MGKSGKKKAIKWGIFFLLVLMVLFFIISDDKMEREAKYQKVLVVGIDAMDPKVATALIEQGKLPNFKKLAEQGSFLNLSATMPPHSPVAWTSIATGTNPGRHNIFDFIRRNPDHYMPELSLSKAIEGLRGTSYESLVKADPFWRITTRHKIPTTVIRWPVTFPPEEIFGNLLAGLGVPDIKGLLGGYTFYTSEEFDKDLEKNEKTVKVVQDRVIRTSISGPRIDKQGTKATVPLEVTIDNEKREAVVRIQDGEYVVKEKGWSDWIRIQFKVGLLKKVSGITLVYLDSVDPFRMYMGDIEIDPENPVFDISSPKEYSADLAHDIGTYHTLGLIEETGALNDEKIDDEVFLQHAAQIEKERDAMWRQEFRKFYQLESGVLAFVYDTGDRIQHMFWDHKVLGNQGEKFRIHPSIEAYYRIKDKWLGEVLEKIDDTTLLLIVSDHGISSFERAVTVNTWLVENGYMTLTKELNELDGKDDGALFRYVDWSRTKAYSVGFNSIFINTKGRERDGMVEAAEKRALKREIIEKLNKLTDPESGKPVVFKMYDTEREYSGPAVEEGPDLAVGFYPGYRMSWQNAVGGFTPGVFSDNKKHWVGDHLIDPIFVPGVLFSNVKLDDGGSNLVSQMNVAPTILEALGIEIPPDMDGKSLLK